jgi:hypothetical protein
MPFFGSGQQQTTTQSNPGPWGPAKPLYKTAMRDAMSAYTQGIGGQGYTGSTVVPMSKQTTDAYGGMMKSADRNSGGNGMSGNLQGILNNGGFNGYQKDALGNFRDTANSSYDMNANPGFADVLKRAEDDARNQVNMTASANGRYGSGVQQGAVARETGNTAANLISNNYNQWLGRKDAANSSLFNAAQAGIGNMGAAYGALQQPQQTKLGVGSAYEDLYKRTLDDRLRIYDDAQNAPWKQIQRLQGVAGGTSGFNPSMTTSTAPGPNPLLQGLGTAATGMSLYQSMFGGAPAAAGSGGLSALLGL